VQAQTGDALRFRLTASPHSPYLTDNFGRKLPIAIGCVIMIVGAILQGSSNDLGSKYQRARRWWRRQDKHFRPEGFGG